MTTHNARHSDQITEFLSVHTSNPLKLFDPISLILPRNDAAKAIVVRNVQQHAHAQCSLSNIPRADAYSDVGILTN
jgi:hypothetical protein